MISFEILFALIIYIFSNNIFNMVYLYSGKIGNYGVIIGISFSIMPTF